MWGIEKNRGCCDAWRVFAFALGVAALSGCATSYDRDLLFFEAKQASYPVMLSSVPQRGAGQPLVAHAEMQSNRVTTSSRYGNTTITTTMSAAGRSPLDISDHLAQQVPPTARWVQIDRLVYTGEDSFQSLVFAARGSSKRAIDVEGTTHR
jgi:hypothetical protein